jgi:hypothetical protein
MKTTNKTPGICKFTEKDFLEELSRFREACGSKTFWARPEEQQAAMISGLAFLYLNLGNDDGSMPDQEQIDKWGGWMSDALFNYNQRKTILQLRPPGSGRGAYDVAFRRQAAAVTADALRDLAEETTSPEE